MVGSVQQRTQGDRCPGALRLHDAADGPLARLRVPGGLLTAGAVRALCDAANAVGDAALHLTIRGNIEVRSITDAEAFAAAAAAAGLLPSATHERIRNILASPLAGLDGRGNAAAGGLVDLVRALDEALLACPPLAGLSGRFLFGLDDGRGDILGVGPDLGVVLVTPARARLVVAGARTDVLLPVAGVPDALAAAARAFLDACAAPGTRPWRLRELGPELAAVRARLTAAARPWSTGSSCGQEPAGSLGAAGPAEATLLPPRPGLLTGPGGDAGCVAQPVLGTAPTSAWRALADAAADGDGLVRTTPGRAVVVAALAPETARGHLRAFRQAGLVVDPDDPWVGVSACTGRPGCARALADVRADAGRVSRGPARPVYLAGCERRCGHPSAAHVELVATGRGYASAVVGQAS